MYKGTEDFSGGGTLQTVGLTSQASRLQQNYAPRAAVLAGSANVRFLPDAPAPRTARPSLTLSRMLDLAVASAALVFFAPVMLSVIAAIRLSGNGPVLFSQKRVGLNGRRFECLKFRTMRSDAEQILAEMLATDANARAEWARTQKLRQDPRISRLGKFLRKTSLDELPQLFNVFKGDMSVVGPRPIVAEEIERYGRNFRHYAAVKPGLTGMWQINGRNDVSYRRRVACDALYARRKSVTGDIAIIAKTVPVLLFGKGAY